MSSEAPTPADPNAGSVDSSGAHEAGERAARNTAVRAAGEIIGKLGSLVLFAVLARELGEAHLGVFVLALGWAEVAMTPVGLGIDQYLLKQVAADRARMGAYLWNALYLKMLRAVPVVIGSVVATYVLGFSAETRQTVVIITVGLLFDTMARTPANVFTAYERGELVAVAIVVQRILAAAAGLALLFAGYGVVAVAIAWSGGAVIRFALSMAFIRSRLGWPRIQAPMDTRRDIRKHSMTFTAQDLFGLVLMRADVLLLAALTSDAVVGEYGSAYRLFEATTFIEVALAGAFSAMFTYLGTDTKPTLEGVFQRAIKLCLALLLPITMTFALLAEPLCRAFFGDELADAAEPLRLLAPVVVLFGVQGMSTLLVLNRSRPRRMVYTVAVAAVVNLVLNLTLIPPFEGVGAALAMLGSFAVYTAIAFWQAVDELERVNWVSMLAAPAVASAAMAVPLVLLAGIWPVAALAGGVVFVAVYAAVDRVVDPDDLRFVVDLLRRRLPGGRRPVETGVA